MSILDDPMPPTRGLAVVTGGSSGIGLEFARLCAQNGFDLIIAADEPDIGNAATSLAGVGAVVTPVQCDLATLSGVERLLQVIADDGRPVDLLMANAGRSLNRAFLDQDIFEALHVVHTNIDGMLYLLHAVVGEMRGREQGRVLITGSIAGFMPGTAQAVYNASMAFVDSFAAALGAELSGSGVTVTRLLPGVTDTRMFERAGLLEARAAVDDRKDDPADVAQTGFDALMRGDDRVVHGVTNKFRTAAARVTGSTGS